MNEQRKLSSTSIEKSIIKGVLFHFLRLHKNLFIKQQAWEFSAVLLVLRDFPLGTRRLKTVGHVVDWPPHEWDSYCCTNRHHFVLQKKMATECKTKGAFAIVFISQSAV